MYKRRNDAGQALVVVAISLVALLGFAGLAIDMGYMRYVKRQMQTLADAAAVAGARELGACGSTANCAALKTAAQEAVVENGFTVSALDFADCTPAPVVGSAHVIVRNSPACGGANDPHTGDVNYVETIVSTKVPVAFAKMVGISSPYTIAARGEAGVLTSTNSSAVLLGLGGTDLNMADAAATINAGGGIYDNSASSCNGNATINASTLYDVGTNSGCNASGGVTTGNLPVSDPLAYLAQYAPCSGNGCGACTTVSGGTTSLGPGTYCGISAHNVAFSPGTYIIEGALSPKNGTWTGTGVTFYLTGTTANNFGGINAGANGNIGTAATQFSAPTSGNLKGILFWQDPNAVGVAAGGTTTGATFAANAVCNCQGILYFPTTTMDYQGGPNAAYTVIVAYSLTMHGNASLGINFSSIGGSPLRIVSLGE